MKVISLLLIVAALAAAAVYFDAAAYVMPLSDKEKALMPRAEKECGGSIPVRRDWIARELACEAQIDAAGIDGASAEDVDKIKREAREKCGESAEKRLHYVGVQLAALGRLSKIERNSGFSAEEAAALSAAVRAEYPDNLEKRAECAAAYAAYIVRAKSWRAFLSESDFKTAYSAFWKKFSSSPPSAIADGDADVRARAEFLKMRLPPELNGIREFLKNKYPEWQLQNQALRSILENGFSHTDCCLWNVRVPEGEFKYWDRLPPQWKLVFKGSVYFCTGAGKQPHAALLITDGKKKFFVMSVNGLPKTLDSVKLSRAGETVECEVSRFSESAPVVILEPKSPPSGDPVYAGKPQDATDNMMLLGPNCFGFVVSRLVMPQNSGGDFILFYSSDNIPLFAEGALAVNERSSLVVGMKVPVIADLRLDESALTADDAEKILRSSAKPMKGLPEVEKKYIESLAPPRVEPMAFAALDKILMSARPANTKKISEKLEELAEFSAANRAVFKAAAQNKFSAFISDDMAKSYPELAKTVKTVGHAISKGGDMSRGEMLRQYGYLLRRIRELLISDRDEFKRKSMPLILTREVARQREFREMLIGLFPENFSSDGEDGELLFTDVSEGVNGKSYTPVFSR